MSILTCDDGFHESNCELNSCHCSCHHGSRPFPDQLHYKVFLTKRGWVQNNEGDGFIAEGADMPLAETDYLAHAIDIAQSSAIGCVCGAIVTDEHDWEIIFWCDESGEPQ